MSCNSSFSLNLVPRALFPGFEGAKARERRPGDEVGSLSVTNVRCGPTHSSKPGADYLSAPVSDKKV